jgi:iron(III) transport system permease protein
VLAPRPTGPRRPSRWTLTALAIAATVAVPPLAVVSSLTQPAQGVWAHLWRTQLVELTLNTLALLAGVGLGTFVLGTALGWLVTSYEFPGRRVFEWALVLPLALPAYVIGFAVLGLLDYAGPLQSALRSYLGPGAVLPNPRAYWGVVLVMTLVFYPYVYLLARTAFREQGAATLETARVLGRSRWQAFRQVSLPMARPSLVAGTSLAMMEALADFGTVATFGYRTLTEAIYRVWYGMFDRIAATQLASLLLLFALALLVLERSLRGRARFVQSQRRGLDVQRVPLTGSSAASAVVGCLAVLAAAFVAPVGRLLRWARDATAGGTAAVPAFGAALANTVLLAAAAAVVTGVLGLALVYATRLQPATVVRMTTRLAGMGYALPGSVIAVGVLLPLVRLDHGLAALGERILGHPVGLALTGSAAALVFAYTVRFLAVSLQTLDASLLKIPPSLDDAARSLGASIGSTLTRIHLPLMRGGVFTALVLVFVETVKEMPATLLLRPFGLDTLAVEVWQHTAESQWTEASIPALAIVAAGLLPVFLAIRFSSRPH